MRARTKSTLFLVLKLTVASVLVGWLVRSGTLDFAALGVFFRHPLVLVVALGNFVLGLFVAAIRWRALLELAGAKVPLGRALRLQMTAFFFNVVIPGNVGGDVIKALYVVRDEPKEKHPAILLIVFVERLLGLAGLVVLATLVALIRAPMVFGSPLLRPLATTVCVLGAVSVAGAAGFVVLLHVAGNRLELWTSGPSAFAKLLNRLVGAMRLMSRGPKTLAFTLVLSMLGHAGAMTVFALLASSLTGEDVPFASIATIFPLGLLTLILPISVAGVGVGHLVFARLFESIGLHGGANVFNAYLVGQLVPCLVGVVPYMSLRRSLPREETPDETA